MDWLESRWFALVVFLVLFVLFGIHLLLLTYLLRCLLFVFLEGSASYSCTRLSNNRSVMPLDVLGCTRATMERSTRCLPAPKGAGNPLKSLLNWDCGLQFFLMNEEFLVSANHQFAMITSLPFVHTARRYYRLNDSVRPLDWRPRMKTCSFSWVDGKMSKLDHLEEVKVVTRFP